MVRSFITSLLALQFCFLRSNSRRWKVWICGGTPWPVTVYDNDEVMKSFQGWLTAWQSDCSNKILWRDPAPSYGLGASVHQAAELMVAGMEWGHIYRPDGGWIWAAEDKLNCSLPTSDAVDCFSEPLSYCGTSKAPIQRNETAWNKTLLNLPLAKLDSCTMASTARKSLQWVFGQLIHYFLRPLPDIESGMNKRIALVYNSTTLPRGSNSSSISVHVRGGAPDFGRVPANVSVYMKYVDTYAERLQQEGRPVSVVYLCSDLPEDNIKSSEYMAQQFPRSWVYVVLPHLSLGSGEAEFKMKNKDIIKPPRKDLYIEYLTDIEVLARSTVFIGTLSNVYLLAASLRVARNPTWAKNETCFVDTRHFYKDHPPLFCEGDIENKKLWSELNMNGFNPTEGSSF